MDGEQPLPPTGTSQSELDARWEQLLADAQENMIAYMQQRTPVELQPHLRWYMEQMQSPEAPEPEPLPPNQAVISDGDSVVVIGDSAFPAPGSPGTASVIGGTLQGVQLQPLGGLEARVRDGDTVDVDAAGSPYTGTLEVAGSTLTKVTVAGLTVVQTSRP